MAGHGVGRAGVQMIPWMFFDLRLAAWPGYSSLLFKVVVLFPSCAQAQLVSVLGLLGGADECLVCFVS